MDSSLKILAVRGIDIRIHITFPLILVWAAFQFGLITGAGWVGALFGVIVVTLLFVIVTLHELGHSLAALRYGIPVKQIVLLPIGGVAQLKEIPENPGQELVIAGAGPAVNFVLGALMWALAGPLGIQLVNPAEVLSNVDQVTLAGIYNAVFAYNISLAVFNLIPAFPLDGGRVLRALLATRLPYARATSLAVSIGRGFAWLLGLYGFLGGGFFLIILAVFIYIGAGQEGAMVQVRNILRGFTVGEAYSREAHTLPPTATLQEAAELVLSSLQSSFPVCDGGRLVGMLTYPRLVRALDETGRSGPVIRAMIADVPTVTEGMELIEAQSLLNEKKLDALPVVAEGRFLGLLTSRDIGEMYRLLSVAPDLLERRRTVPEEPAVVF